jgi:LPXTG-motif cell wall-anchored protein
MSNVMRGFLIVTGITAMLVIGFASSASATDFGPPPGAPTITCDKIEIDPPSVSWISVTFSGDVNGAAFTKTVSYGAPTPHIASADITDLTEATGPLHITASATWTLGSDVTLTCHAPPPVTTEGVTATSAPTTTTTTTMPAAAGTTIAPSTATLATDATPPSASSLPLTGASTRPLATTGALAVLAGLAAALGTKRRRKHTA